MNLPTIQENKDLQQAVDAKELYQSLGLNSAHWAKWHSRNIDNNPFAVEGEDYQGFTQWVSGNKTKNYLLSIHFAKKLAMQVRTEKGEQVRDYFLKCEELAKRQVAPQLPDFTNPVAAARAWADELEQKQIAMQKLAIAEPKAKALDVIDSSEGALNIRDTGKTLGIGQKKFIEWALKNEWLYRDSKNKLQAYSKRIQQGYLEIKATTYGHASFGSRATTQTVVTPQGLVQLSKVFSSTGKE